MPQQNTVELEIGAQRTTAGALPGWMALPCLYRMRLKANACGQSYCKKAGGTPSPALQSCLRRRPPALNPIAPCTANAAAAGSGI